MREVRGQPCFFPGGRATGPQEQQVHRPRGPACWSPSCRAHQPSSPGPVRPTHGEQSGRRRGEGSQGGRRQSVNAARPQRGPGLPVDTLLGMRGAARRLSPLLEPLVQRGRAGRPQPLGRAAHPAFAGAERQCSEWVGAWTRGQPLGREISSRPLSLATQCDQASLCLSILLNESGQGLLPGTVVQRLHGGHRTEMQPAGAGRWALSHPATCHGQSQEPRSTLLSPDPAFQACTVPLPAEQWAEECGQEPHASAQAPSTRPCGRGAGRCCGFSSVRGKRRRCRARGRCEARRVTCWGTGAASIPVTVGTVLCLCPRHPT